MKRLLSVLFVGTDKTSLFVFVSLQLFVATGLCQLSPLSDCNTPTGQRGQCLIIQQCPVVVSILTNAPRPLPQSTRETLTSLSCGFEGRSPKVCCEIQRPNNNDDRITRPAVNNDDRNRRPAISNDDRNTRPAVNNDDRNRRPAISNDDRNTRPTFIARDPAQPSTYYSEAPPSYVGHSNIRLLPQNCGLADENRILGGTKARIFEFPWMVLLSYNTPSGQRFKCGGTVINERYILTAAHCITNLGRDVINGVRVGEHDLTKDVDCEDDEPNVCAPPYQDLGISQSIPHPNFVGFRTRSSPGRLQNDIGLLRLSTPIDMTKENAKPVCLPLEQRDREMSLNSEDLWVSGWGVTEEGRRSPYLLKVRLPYVSNDQCGRVLNSSIEDGVGFRQLCAGGNEGFDACSGDSGGPLHVQNFRQGYLRYYQQGVVSFGARNCGRVGVPGVYTRVTHYMRWILDNLRP